MRFYLSVLSGMLFAGVAISTYLLVKDVTVKDVTVKDVTVKDVAKTATPAPYVPPDNPHFCEVLVGDDKIKHEPCDRTECDAFFYDAYVLGYWRVLGLSREVVAYDLDDGRRCAGWTRRGMDEFRPGKR